MDIRRIRTGFMVAMVAAGAGGTMLAAPLLGNLATVTSAVAQGVEQPKLLPVANVKAPAAAKSETAVLAGGCFWGIQGVFQHVKGVTSAVSGYAGGDRSTAVYEVVGTGRTGHAEAVQITFDPSVISYDEILRIFFSVATDPTQVNKQEPDIGPQYRNVIFYQSPEQKRVAEAYITQLNGAKVFKRPIATTLASSPFYRAEAYHQDYLTLNPRQPYIAIHDMPKLEALKKLFPQRYRPDPVLVGKKKA
jgi:peptide-methionine (S)-S-oxide reductase